MEAQMTGKAETLVDGLTVPEGPRWHNGRLWFSDMHASRVCTVDLSGRIELVAEVAGKPSGLGWTTGNSLLIVSIIQRRVLRLEAGKLELFADLSLHTSSPCNDMVSDDRGRSWVGDIGFDLFAGAEPSPGRIWHVGSEGLCHLAADGLAFPNGMVITANGQRLIAAETFGERLTCFDIGSDGSLSNRREFAACQGAYPDGICLDADGAVWVADPASNRAFLIREGGQVIKTVTVAEDRHVYACALGGDDGRTLFLCTSSKFSHDQSWETKPGRIEVFRVDVPSGGLQNSSERP
jgi:sugar lactone lactonase YvrE